MRTYGAFRPTDQIPVPPDTVGVGIISSAAAVVAQDWPTGAQMVSFAGTMNFYANFFSTGSAVPSTNSSGSTAVLSGNILNPTARQIPSASTGYSLTAPTSGVITIEFWKK